MVKYQSQKDFTMSQNNNNKKIHNPKSNAPAVYIPCWLIQIPVKELSHGSKLVYGRLSQWCDSTGQAFRSVPQLSEELGMCESSVEKYLKQLKDVGLIDTFHPQAGGVNHFEFYDHPWMHDKINEHLIYKSDKYDPPYEHTAPSVRSYGTPPYKHTDINNKEIIINNINNSSDFFENYKKQEVENLTKVSNDLKEDEMKSQFKVESLNDSQCKEMYKKRFAESNVTLERLYDDCCDYWSQKGQMVYKARFLTHLTRCPINCYPEKELPQEENKPSKEETKKETDLKLNYREYYTRIKADIDLKLLPMNTCIMSFDNWKQNVLVTDNL
jgi:hypothetical protein